MMADPKDTQAADTPLTDAEKELAASLDALWTDEPVTEQASVRDRPDLDLMTRFSKLGQVLLDMGELTEAKTQEGRDLHSEYNAIHHELLRRGLM